MTFEEAFNSGCRFKLPKNYINKNSWPDDWWLSNNKGKIKPPPHAQTDRVEYTVEEYLMFDNNTHLFRSLYLKYKQSIDWYLHPVDEHNMKFNQKLEKLVNE